MVKFPKATRIKRLAGGPHDLDNVYPSKARATEAAMDKKRLGFTTKIIKVKPEGRVATMMDRLGAKPGERFMYAVYTRPKRRARKRR